MVPTPAVERRLGELLDGLMPYYEPEELPADGRHDVRILAAPVRRHGQPVLVLALYGLPEGASTVTVESWAAMLVEAASEVSAALPATSS